MVTKAQAAARADLFKDLTELQKIMSELWVDQSLPEGWNGLELEFPRVPKKRKVTIWLDADVYAWFQKFGKGFQKRINAVLRIYRNGVVSGDVKSFASEYSHAPDRVKFLEKMEERFEAKLFELIETGAISKAELENLRKGTDNQRDLVKANEEVLRLLGRIEGAGD